MKKILYILKENSGSETLFPLLSEQKKNNGMELRLVLIQSVSNLATSPPIHYYTLIKKGDGQTDLAPSSGGTSISYMELLELIFSVDSTVVW